MEEHIKLLNHLLEIFYNKKDYQLTESLEDLKQHLLAEQKGLSDEIWNQGQNERGGISFREKLITALASNSALIKYDWRIKDRDADFITKEKIIFAEDSAKMIVKFADAIIEEMQAGLSS